MDKVRVRFAPSPTGWLHIGSIRAVLINYLVAKSLGGKLILRIEDTDQKREEEGAVVALLDILDWLGFEFDEGPVIKDGDKNLAHKNQLGTKGEYGPYIQSQRLNLYQKYINELILKKEVYYCFCSQEKLQKMREDQQAKKEPPRYDRTCRNLSEEEAKKKIAAGVSYVIRQKMPLIGEIRVKDELRGEIQFRSQDMDDQILIKSNGMPTYQFASVVDDHLMEISHVVRGEEWIPSLPKNILLYQAFGWQPPKFIHIPLSLNKDGGKLSKRQGDVAVEDYRAKGYLPEALLNFSALSGWRPRNSDQEIFSLKEMVKIFKIEDINTGGTIFDIEKLDYLNGYYIRQKSLNELTDLCLPYLEKCWQGKKIATNKLKDRDYLKKVIVLEQERLKKLSDIGEATEFFFNEEIEYDADLLIWKKLPRAEIKNNLEKIYKELTKIKEEDWSEKIIEHSLMSCIRAKGKKVGDCLWPMRVALTGRKNSPGPFEVAGVLGKKESLERIKSAINLI